MKRTARGFAIFGTITDSYGNTITLQESSAGGGPFAWVFVRNRDGVDAYIHKPTGSLQAVSPHLTRTQARRLARLLLRFADADSPSPGMWPGFDRKRKDGAR